MNKLWRMKNSQIFGNTYEVEEREERTFIYRSETVRGYSIEECVTEWVSAEEDDVYNLEEMC